MRQQDVVRNFAVTLLEQNALRTSVQIESNCFTLENKFCVSHFYSNSPNLWKTRCSNVHGNKIHAMTIPTFIIFENIHQRRKEYSEIPQLISYLEILSKPLK